MWKFILFIIVGSIIIWQLGLLNMGNSTPSTPAADNTVNTVKESVKKENGSPPKAKENENAKTAAKKENEKREEVSIKKNALENLLTGKVKSIEIKKEAQKASSEDKKEALKKITRSAVSQNSYQSMLEQEADEDMRPENAVVIKGAQTSFGTPKKEKSEEEKYADMLAKEAEDSAGDNVVRLGGDKTASVSGKEAEKILEKEPVLSSKEEEIKPVSVKEDEKTSKILFRENLKKLIASAGIKIKDDKLASLIDEETPTENAVKIKPKSKKDLIKEIINEVGKQATGKNKEYVVGLLKEVSTSKIDILKVEKDYTLVKIKEGDNLWNIAKKIYNDPYKYKLIAEANKDILTNPNMVTVGMVIKVPKIK